MRDRLQSPIEVKSLGKLCQEYLRQEFNDGTLPKQQGALSLDTVSNAVSSLAQHQALSRAKM